MSDADELFKFLGKLGKEVVETAEDAAQDIKQAAKHVTGLGRGAVVLELDTIEDLPVIANLEVLERLIAAEAG